ncbi:hypothetical protein HYH03_005571 [Edaphochlamys debaryana]|uniref:Uncharacterized protein n=1 Tax=Edaphochlamys debaryana TaxID=47281 RepID=A0A835Y8U6_9CHLO|nr:hypothetical protein HYH03_005571 [Edaphochlamys debaryana]|eukprot:KAG2496341.1 hypothetical protein HYH03_005571 [Edaphochlamys debaryana]
MRSRRRSSDFLLQHEPPDVQIVVADPPQEPLSAHFDVLKLYSKVARDLPRSSPSSYGGSPLPGASPASCAPSIGSPTVWDLSQLIIEDESAPVSATIVRRWLELVYSRVDSTVRVDVPRTLEEVKPLLLFCDAVDTARVVVEDVQRMLLANADLALRVPLGPPPAPGAPRPPRSPGGADGSGVELLLRGRLYYMESGLKYIAVPGEGRSVAVVIPPPEFEPFAAGFPAAACAAVEEALFLGSRMGMVELCRLLMGFVKQQLFTEAISVLMPAAHTIYSPRVIQMLPRELLYHHFLQGALLYQPTSLQVEPIQDRAQLFISVASPEGATWFGERPNSVIEVEVRKGPAGRSLLRHGTTLALNATVGGPNPESAARLVREALPVTLGE